MGALALMVVVGLVLYAVIQQTAPSRNFVFTSYQGADELGVPAADARFEDVIGQGKPVLLNFWAGNCPPCRAEMPDLQASWERFGDQITFFGIDIGPYVGLGNRRQARALLQELNVTYPAAAADEAGIVQAYGVTGLPQTFFYDAAGNEVRKWPGILNSAQLERILRDDLGIQG